MWTLGHYIFHLTSFFSNVIITIGPRGSPAFAKLLFEAFSEHHSVTLKATGQAAVFNELGQMEVRARC